MMPYYKFGEGVNFKKSLLRQSWSYLRVFVTAICCYLSFNSYAQLIEVGDVDPGPYGPGSDITIPITVKSSFIKGTRFELYLSDVNGIFNPLANPIGVFESHFTTYVNGIIPAMAVAGIQYRLRIKIVNSEEEYTVNCSQVISVSSVTGPAIKIDPVETNRILIADKIWGYCTLIKDGNILTIKNQSATGAVVTGTLFNDYNPSAAPVNFDFASSSFYPLSLNIAYYTVRFKAVKGGIVSTRSYAVLNSTYNLSLQSSGTQTACIPAIDDPSNSYGESALIHYSVNAGIPSNDNKGSILSNYPGLVYRFDWGDNTTDYITQQQLVDSSGNVRHHYSESSCGREPIPLKDPIYNSYQANIFIEAPFCTGASTPITTYPKVYKSPVANFEIPGGRGCVNRPITILNTTIPGQAEDASGTSCTDETSYIWYVKKSTDPESAWMPYSDEQSFTYTFTSTGTYNIRLVASNNSCTPSEKIQDICIEETPHLDFDLTQSSGCTPADITVNNNTPTGNICKISWRWTVLDSLTATPVTAGISFLTADTIASPQIRVTNPGSYILRLTTLSACDTLILDKPFTIAGPLSVSMPDARQICRPLPLTIDFAADEISKPVYTGFGKNKTYQWTVSGGTFSFERGTTASAYPAIKFNDPGVYHITVTYTNECNTPVSDTEIITFYGPIIRDAGPDGYICDNVPAGPGQANTTYQLHGNEPLAYETGEWAVVGDSPAGAVFDDAAKHDAVIANLVPGVYHLRWTISNPAGCAEYDEMDLTVYAKPDGGAITGSSQVCFDGASALKVTGSQGKIIGWESSSDNTIWTPMPGTEDHDTYTFEHLQQKTYFRIKTGSSGADHSCGTVAYSAAFKVEVDPLSAGGTADGQATFCEGAAVAGDISLSGNTGNIVRWEKSVDGGSSWAPVASTANPFHYSGITATTQFRAVVQSGLCSTATSSPVTITIEKKPTEANAGDDEFICLTGPAFQLHGNIPVTGTGLWTRTAGPAVTIDHNDLYNATVSGLQKGTRYEFTWTISNGVCTPSADAMILDVLSDIANSVKAGRAVSCKGDAVTLSTDVLTGGNVAGYPANYSFVWESSPDGVSNWTAITGANDENITVHPFSTTYFRRRVSSFESCGVVSAPVEVFINSGTPEPSAGSDATLCNVTAYQLNGNNPGAGFTGTWKDTATGSTLTFYPDEHTPNAEVRGLEPGKSYLLQWTIGGISPCPDKSAVVKITVRKQVTVANAGTDQQLCLNKAGSNNTTILAGNAADTTNGEAGEWKKVAGPAAVFTDASLYNTTITGLQPGQYTFEWKITNDAVTGDPACNVSKATVHVNVTAYPVPGTISGLVHRLCQGSDPGELKLINYTGGALLQWQSSPDNNVFTDIAGATTEKYSPGNLNATVWYRVVVKQADGCSAAEVTPAWQIVVDEPTEGGVAVSDLAKVCTGTNAVTILLKDQKGDIVRWETSPDNATWTPVPGTSNPYIFNNLSSDIYYRAIVRNGSCAEAASASVFIQVLPNVTTADAGADQYLCDETSFRLAGNIALKGTGVWSQLSGPPAMITDPADPQTTVTGTTPGTYTFTWSISNNICPPSTDNVVIYNYAPLTNAISGATTICSGQAVHVTGPVPAGGNGSYSYQWFTSSTGNAPWNVISGVTTEDYTGILMSTAYFKRVVISGPCTLESNAVLITVQPPVTNNVIAGEQELCLGQAAGPVTGTLPSGGDGIYTYQWQESTDGLSWTNIAGGTAINYQPPVLSHTTLFRRIVTTSLCTGDQQSASNTVQIIVHPLPKAEFTASKQKACSPFNLKDVISLIPYDDRNASYEWFVNGTSIGVSKDFPGYTISNDGELATVKLVTASKFGCGTNSMELVFETVKHVVASFTKDQTKGCGPLQVSFTNTSAPLSGADYLWDFGNGQTSVLEQPGTIVFTPHPLHRDTTYIIKLTASTGCQSTEYIDSVTVRPHPLASFSPDKTRGCSPFEISMTNESKGMPNTYIFDFGDGNTLTQNDNSQVKHIYYTTKTDTVTLKLKAINECGADSSSYQIVIFPNTVTAELVVDGNRKYGCVPFTVKFDNNSTGANRFYWDFQDGNTLVTTQAPESVTHTFTVPGTYNVSLVATNGCSTGSTSETVTVYPKPDSEFSINKTLNCVKDSVLFINEQNPASSFIWDFGDGSYSNLSNPKHAYLHAGKYDVKLTAVQSYPDGSVCSNTTTHAIEIFALPVASFTSNSSALNCAPYKLIVATTPANASGVQWDFGDPASGADNITNGYSAEHTYTEPGVYKIRLTAYNESGCTDTISGYVRIAARPEPEFTLSDTSVCGPSAAIIFTNKSVYAGADAVSYRWVVNDVVVAKTKDLTYLFTAPVSGVMPARFEVKLIAVSTLGCPDTVVHYFQLNPLPEASFTASETIGCPPLRLRLQNTSRYAGQYAWYLDGALVSNEKEPENIILKESDKNYQLKLVVSNIYGCRESSAERTVSTYPKPAALFSIPDSISCNGKLDLKITNNSTGAVRYLWDFGDNSGTSTEPAPAHIYGQPGVYKLRLIAYNTVCSDTAAVNVRIAAVPKAAFTSDITKGCTLVHVTFQNLSENAGSCLWDFGDGSYSTERNPRHTFTYMNSPYNVKLTVYGEFGCSSEALLTNFIQVIPPPTADFVALPDSVIKIPEYTFNFKNMSSGDPVKYEWSFGDGQTSQEESPAHTYINTGEHQVQLIVTNAEGCRDTIMRKVRIDGVPGYLYVPNGFEPGSFKAELKVFKPKGSGIAKYSIKIFDTWGRLLWESDKLDDRGSPIEGWDGTMSGRPVPQGVYIWRIDAVFIDGTEWKGMKYTTGPRSTVGPVHLIR